MDTRGAHQMSLLVALSLLLLLLLSSLTASNATPTRISPKTTTTKAPFGALKPLESAAAARHDSIHTSVLSYNHVPAIKQGKDYLPVHTQVAQKGAFWHVESAPNQQQQPPHPPTDPLGYHWPEDSDIDEPSPERMQELKNKLQKVLKTLWVNASYDPKLDKIPSGPCQWFATLDSTFLPDFPGDGGFAQANLHNNLGFTNLPGNINGQGSLVHHFWFSGVLASDVIDSHGNDIWPRWAINNLTQWKVQLINYTMPFRPKVAADGTLIYPRRCITGRQVPIITGDNGGGDWLLGEYGRRVEKAVSYGFDVTWPVNPSGDFNPTWQNGVTTIARNTSELPGRSRVLHSRLQADYILAQNANPQNAFRHEKFNPAWHIHIGHSFGDMVGKVNNAGAKGWGIPPHPFWQPPLYVAGVDGTPEAQLNADMDHYNWTGIMLLTGNTMPDPQLARVLPKNLDKVGSAHVLIPGCYHQWCGQTGDCPFSVLSQVLDVAPFMQSPEIADPGWFLDTCAANKSTWINTKFDPIPLQKAQDLNSWMEYTFSIAFSLMPRVDEGFKGQYVPLGQQDEFLHHILSVDQLYAAQGNLLPVEGESICYSGLNKCGVYQFHNVTTPVKTARAMRFHGYYSPDYPYNDCSGYAGSLSDTSFSPYGSGGYAPVITNVTETTFVWAEEVVTSCGTGVRYFQPTKQQLASIPACKYTLTE